MTAPAKTWTAEEIRALGVRTDLVTAYRIVLGGGKNRAWLAYHQGELPFPALKVGRRVVVPVAPLLRLLGVEDEAAGLNPSEDAEGPELTRATANHLNRTSTYGQGTQPHSRAVPTRSAHRHRTG